MAQRAVPQLRLLSTHQWLSPLSAYSWQRPSRSTRPSGALERCASEAATVCTGRGDFCDSRKVFTTGMDIQVLQSSQSGGLQHALQSSPMTIIVRTYHNVGSGPSIIVPQLHSCLLPQRPLLPLESLIESYPAHPTYGSHLPAPCTTMMPPRQQRENPPPAHTSSEQPPPTGNINPHYRVSCQGASRRLPNCGISNTRPALTAPH